MPDEIMPHVTEALFAKRALLIDNIKTDHSSDLLRWVEDPDLGSDVMYLSEAQTRSLLATFAAHVAEWDNP